MQMAFSPIFQRRPPTWTVGAADVLLGRKLTQTPQCRPQIYAHFDEIAKTLRGRGRVKGAGSEVQYFGPLSVLTFFICILSLLLPPYLFRLFCSFFLPAKVSKATNKEV